MKFKKALLINISEDKLDPLYWKRLDSLVNKKISLPKNSPQIVKELADTDCILTGFLIEVGKKEIDAAPNLKYVSVLATVPNEITDLDVLEERLKKGDITFISDHPEELDPKVAKRLSKYKSCIFYPPVGYISDEAREAKQEIFLGNMEAFLKGKPQNVVNL